MTRHRLGRPGSWREPAGAAPPRGPSLVPARASRSTARWWRSLVRDALARRGIAGERRRGPPACGIRSPNRAGGRPMRRRPGRPALRPRSGRYEGQLLATLPSGEASTPARGPGRRAGRGRRCWPGRSPAARPSPRRSRPWRGCRLGAPDDGLARAEDLVGAQAVGRSPPAGRCAPASSWPVAGLRRAARSAAWLQPRRGAEIVTGRARRWRTAAGEPVDPWSERRQRRAAPGRGGRAAAGRGLRAASLAIEAQALVALPGPGCCWRWLAAARSPERLAQVGQAADAVADREPDPRAGYRRSPCRCPTPSRAECRANSLWRSGAKGFFRDQRARASATSSPCRSACRTTPCPTRPRARGRPTTAGHPRFLRLQNLAVKALPDADRRHAGRPQRLVKMDSRSRAGRGAVTRAEEIRMNVAAVVTQVLPNGNLVIQGRQEVRVNFEMREVVVAGIARPEDITPKNTIAPREDRRAARRLWRPWPDHRRAAAALRRPGAGHPAALLRPAQRGRSPGGGRRPGPTASRPGARARAADLHHVLDPAVEEGPAVGAVGRTGRRASRGRSCPARPPASRAASSS